MDPRGLEWQVAELRRRLDNVARVGAVAEVDLAAARVRVRYAEDGGGEPALTGWLPWLASRAGGDSGWWPPEVGEQALLVAPGGELPNAVALAGLYSDARPAPSGEAAKSMAVHADGASVEYDRDLHRMRHDAEDGAVIEYDAGASALRATLPGGATVAVTADGGVSITGDVSVDGDLSVTGDASADGDVSDGTGSMDTMRGQHNRHKHPAGTPPAKTGGTDTRME